MGVLGGGLQGCCCALALAERGADVTLFDRNERLLSRTAVANEGKIHLGYMYANDRSYATARMMMQGALAFGPFFERMLGEAHRRLSLSRPASYVVHRDSQRSVEEVSHYLRAVHAALGERASERDCAYFGGDLRAPLREWPRAEREAAFDPAIALAVFDTPEVAINPAVLTEALRKRVLADPRIEVRLRQHVGAVENTECPVVRLTGPEGNAQERFAHVVNAWWDGRLAVDETLGLRPRRRWMHRLKYGVSFRLPAGAERPPSATFVSGPFGEVVSYGDGLTYLTWYPVCLRARSAAVSPPEWPTYPEEPLRSTLLRDTLRAMAAFVTSLPDIETDDLTDVSVKGGVIVAWGETDIDDPASELHRRYEIGVTSRSRYHTVDPGKLTMAPYFAEICAERIASAALT